MVTASALYASQRRKNLCRYFCNWARVSWGTYPVSLASLMVCIVGRNMPQGHCHLFMRMRRLRHPAATLTGGKQEGDACMSAISEEVQNL